MIIFKLIVNYDLKRSVTVQISTALSSSFKVWLGPPPKRDFDALNGISVRHRHPGKRGRH